MNVRIGSEIRERLPQLCVAVVEADAVNSERDDELWQLIHEEERCLQDHTGESIKLFSGIAATRAAYRTLGKDPSRYRPSNEALCRRIVQGKGLYRINTLVDLCNLASMRFHYSIGGFDRSKIVGDVELGIGRAGEPYEGIGRGSLNIDCLPVYRDALGGIGTPTSDNERTKIGLDTNETIFFVNGFDGDREQTLRCAAFIQQLLRRFARSDGGTVTTL